MKPLLKLKKTVAVVPVISPTEKPVVRVDAAARHLANRLLNEELLARRLAQIEKVQPLVDSYFSDKAILQETVFVDSVECLRPLAVGIDKTIFALLRAQPEALDCSNTVLRDLIKLVLKKHVKTPLYLAGLVKFNERFDLVGNAAGEVSAIDKVQAEKLIQKLT